jgi:hypothetical protein
MEIYELYYPFFKRFKNWRRRDKEEEIKIFAFLTNHPAGLSRQ